MNTIAIKNLALGTLSSFGDQVLIVLTAVIGVAIAYFLFTWAWERIKGSVWERKGLSSSDDRPYFWKGERYGKRGTGHWGL